MNNAFTSVRDEIIRMREGFVATAEDFENAGKRAMFLWEQVDAYNALIALMKTDPRFKLEEMEREGGVMTSVQLVAGEDGFGAVLRITTPKGEWKGMFALDSMTVLDAADEAAARMEALQEILS